MVNYEQKMNRTLNPLSWIDTMNRRYLLLASSLMPSPHFVYQPQLLQREDFMKLVDDAYRRGRLESYVSHAATATHIEKLTGITIDINRSEIYVEAGDVMLVCKRRHSYIPYQRPTRDTHDEDFEYWLVEVVEKEKLPS